MLREHNLTGGTRLANLFYPNDPALTDNDGDDTSLTCPDGSLILIKEVKHNRDDEKLHIKGRATVGTTITIIDAETDKVLIEGIGVKEGKWDAEIKNADSTLENITVMTSNDMQLTRKSKIVKMTMMVMTINVKKAAERLPPQSHKILQGWDFVYRTCLRESP